MASIGKTNQLTVVKEVPFGVYLDGEDLGQILLPNAYVPENCKTGDKLDVFIYCDSEDELIATTKTPKAQVGEFAYLKAVSASHVGAFLDWGLSKDLFVPHSEQRAKMQEGQWYVVYIYRESQHVRIAATSKIEKFLGKYPPKYEIGAEVRLLVYEQTDLGYKAVINNSHQGLLYKDELFRNIHVGDALQGYIKKIREDNKIDLILEKPGFQKPDELQAQILDFLQQHKGFMALTDKSSAELIKKVFGVSKKKFKVALGGLYKQRIVRITDEGVHLVVVVQT